MLKNKLRTYQLILIFSFLFISGCLLIGRKRDPGKELFPGSFEQSLMIDERERIYFLHIPECSSDGESLPLVLMFHGGGGHARTFSKHTGWIEKAEEECFLVVFPNGTPEDPEQPVSFSGNPQTWNDGSGRFNQDVDDIAFVEEMIITISEQLPVDPKRIYAAGFSNGASMAFRLGIELDHYFSAVAAVAGALWIPDFSLDDPVSLFYMTGSEDPLNPINGGAPRLAVGENEPGGDTPKPPVEQHIQLWTRALACEHTPKVLVKSDLMDGIIYSDCRGTAVVQYYLLHGVGHHWPGGILQLPQIYLGPATDEINATDLIWEFFEEHPGN
jgi:polyhydroxybutyrate depolymerase